MPYDDPEPDDPQELIGVELPGDEEATREMAAAFAEEFARLGLGRSQIISLFQVPFYQGAYRAWELLGEDEIGRMVDESLAVWGRFACVVTETDDESETGPQPLHVVRRRM